MKTINKIPIILDNYWFQLEYLEFAELTSSEKHGSLSLSSKSSISQIRFITI